MILPQAGPATPIPEIIFACLSADLIFIVIFSSSAFNRSRYSSHHGTFLSFPISPSIGIKLFVMIHQQLALTNTIYNNYKNNTISTRTDNRLTTKFLKMTRSSIHIKFPRISMQNTVFQTRLTTRKHLRISPILTRMSVRDYVCVCVCVCVCVSVCVCV